MYIVPLQPKQRDAENNVKDFKGVLWISASLLILLLGALLDYMGCFDS